MVEISISHLFDNERGVPIDVTVSMDVEQLAQKTVASLSYLHHKVLSFTVHTYFIYKMTIEYFSYCKSRN